MALKVLLADDNMTAQNMGRKILADAGYEVIAVSNGSAALKKFAEHRPDLLVLDVYMPGYSGLEVCEKVKMRAPRSAVLLTVGKMEIYHPEDGRRVRADGLVVKPFEATDLLDAVKKLAENLPAKNGRHSGAAPHDDKDARTNGPARSDNADDESNVTTAALMTARESIAVEASAAPAAVEAVATTIAEAPAEASAASGNGGVSSAVAEAIAQEVKAESSAGAPCATLPHDALLAAFSATPVMYLAPAATPETAEQEEQQEDEQWTHEADKAAAMATAAQAEDAAAVAETPAPATFATEVSPAEAACETAEEDEPESYWIAVRVPLSSTTQTAVSTTAEPPHMETTVNKEMAEQTAGSDVAADAGQTQEAAPPSASLMEQWLHEQARASVETGTAETAPPPAVEYPEHASPALEGAPTESQDAPVAMAAGTAEIAATAEPESSSSLQAIEPAHVDAAAAEAAREVTTQSQSDEIALAVERALERFRETLVEEIARELEKRKR